MAFAIGYNINQANQLMDNVSEAYKNLGIYTKDQWEPVVNTLQQEWVGEDEQDFEKRLAERICNLYVNSYSLVENCINTIAGLAQSWIDFQEKNTLSGEAAEGKSKNKIDIPKIKREDQIVKSKPKSIGSDEDRGLRDASSKTNIQGAVERFVNEIKNKTNGLFTEIESNTSFFGEQTTAIKAYVEKVGVAVGEVTVAVKDMYDALENLANSSYSTASADISQQFSQANTDVENSLNDLGSTRWSA